METPQCLPCSPHQHPPSPRALSSACRGTDLGMEGLSLVFCLQSDRFGDRSGDRGTVALTTLAEGTGSCHSVCAHAFGDRFGAGGFLLWLCPWRGQIWDRGCLCGHAPGRDRLGTDLGTNLWTHRPRTGQGSGAAGGWPWGWPGSQGHGGLAVPPGGLGHVVWQPEVAPRGSQLTGAPSPSLVPVPSIPLVPVPIPTLGTGLCVSPHGQEPHAAPSLQ